MQASDLQRFGGAAARFSAACLVTACGVAAPAHAQLSEPFPAVFDLESLRPSAGGDGSLGFVLRPDWADSGASVASAGDINGDGVDDFIIGATGINWGPCCYSPLKGRAYVVFGRAGGAFPAELSLADLDGSNGFRLDGHPNDFAGASVASAGDVNGDGVDDIIIGAPNASPDGRSYVGAVYVVFGRAGEPFPPVLDLSSLDGANGFRIDGVAADDRAGTSVASAGDVNADGVDDIIIGAPYASPGGRLRAGAAYVVFGRAGGGFPAVLDLGGLDGSTGFRLDGGDTWSDTGRSVASVGDMNNDGVTDIAVGAPSAHVVDPGRVYVVFGRAHAPFPSSLDLSALDGASGFVLDGSAVGDRAGASISSAGDVNADGVADLLLGAPGVEGYPFPAGAGYVIFGRRDGIFDASTKLSSLDGHTGFRLEVADSKNLGASVASAGDINNDGVDDLIILAPLSPGYVVFGRREALFPPVFDLATLNGIHGFRLDVPVLPAFPFPGLGWSYARAVASAGDVNGDGAGDVIVDHFIVFGRHRCDADCDQSGHLDFFDFLCFQNLFAAGDPAADCDGSGGLDFFDFLCFQNDFAAGCP